VASKEDDAFKIINDALRSWGLSSLAGRVRDYLEKGLTDDRIFLELQETDEYKTRFQGNEIRRKNGLAVLSPAEYLAVEASYRQIMESAGLPPGFYDSPDDFSQWIGKNVAPTEVKTRVDTAVNFVDQAPPEARRAMRLQGFTDGDLYAYALDQKKAERLVTQRFRAAELEGRLAQAGQRIGSQTAQAIAAQAGENTNNRDAIQTTARLGEQGSLLGSVYGERYTAETAAREVFMQDAEAGAVRRRLASQERGAFSGQSAIGDRSLSRRQRT
jgi:hypothetical protein